jgi:hypothetical protein
LAAPEKNRQLTDVLFESKSFAVVAGPGGICVIDAVCLSISSQTRKWGIYIGLFFQETLANIPENF